MTVSLVVVEPTNTVLCIVIAKDLSYSLASSIMLELSFTYSYSLLLHCWDEQPEKRPSFSKLVVTIATMMEAVGGYLSLNVADKTNLASDTHLLYYNLETAV